MSQEAEIVLTAHGMPQVMMRGTIQGSYTRSQIINALRTGQAMIRMVQDGEDILADSPRPAAESITVELRKRRGQKVQA